MFFFLIPCGSTKKNLEWAQCERPNRVPPNPRKALYLRFESANFNFRVAQFKHNFLV